MSDLPGDGAVAELRPMASHSTLLAEPNPLEIGTVNWATADKVAGDIIRKVQPTSESEERRREVVDYMQRLIRNFLGAEVFLYGSVPLKTYLPEGDLDFTTFGGANVEETFADNMMTILNEEANNMSAEFIVSDVQLIRAEVQLVKCIVQGIVVDVSFNQVGGLSTLCFLEQVDRLIGKDHLFKRSIILIKAWCFYESRILGAHQGLISTYALETLVLYIFHLFHSKLDGPLAVLHKFLDYFSKFDWDSYGISLNGPVRLSSLPALVAEMPEDSDKDLLLSSDFLSSSGGMFSVPSRGGSKNSHGFQRKHLNIVDPLKETNNLGRSVSRANFYRICSAFTYGARKLEQILFQSEDSIASELYKFFSNTIARRGGGQRPDVMFFDPSLICDGPISAVPIPENGWCKIDDFYEYHDSYAGVNGDFQSSSGKFSEDLLRGMERTPDTENREQYSSSMSKHQAVLLDRSLGPRFHGDSNDLATSGLAGLRISTDSSVPQIPVLEESVTAVSMAYHTPHLYFPNSKLHFGSLRVKSPGSHKGDKCEKKASSLVSSGSDEGRVAVFGSLDGIELVDKDAAVASYKSKDGFWAPQSFSFSGDPNNMDLDQSPASRSETPESLNSLDLTGDYENYLQSFQYGRWCYEYSLGMHSLLMPPLPATPYQNNIPWDGILPISHFKQNGFSHRHRNGFHLSPAVYTMQPVIFPGVTLGWEEVPKPRGTGTYFPNTNQPPHGYRSSSTKGNHTSSSSPRYNGRKSIFREPNMSERSSYELAQPQVQDPSFSHGNGYHNPNGLFLPTEGFVEFESFGHPSGTPMSGNSREQRPVSSYPRSFSGIRRTQSASSGKHNRISLTSSYRLKDEDFPPLSI